MRRLVFFLFFFSKTYFIRAVSRRRRWRLRLHLLATALNDECVIINYTSSFCVSCAVPTIRFRRYVLPGSSFLVFRIDRSPAAAKTESIRIYYAWEDLPLLRVYARWHGIRRGCTDYRCAACEELFKNALKLVILKRYTL